MVISPDAFHFHPNAYGDLAFTYRLNNMTRGMKDCLVKRRMRKKEEEIVISRFIDVVKW